jgi:hypothetical protein
MNRASFAAALLCTLGVSACSGKGNPAAPTPPPSTTPAITLNSVSLAAALSSLDRAGATAQVTATGTFSDGTTQNVTSSCTDWFSDNTFVLTISSGGLMTAHNSGSSTVTTSCQGVQGRGLVTLNLIPAQLWSFSGTGDNVFEMPSYVKRVRVIGTYTRNSSNFIITVNGRLLVNELLGTGWGTTRYDGTLNLPAGPGTVEITNSSGVVWSITEIR